jgi:hypothetical protein
MYKILPYTLIQSKKLGVIVKPSNKKDKKIDVYNKDNKYMLSIGFLGYNDYPNFINKFGKEYADKKRILYKKRHEKDRNIKGSKGFYADKLLW